MNTRPRLQTQLTHPVGQAAFARAATHLSAIGSLGTALQPWMGAQEDWTQPGPGDA